MSINRSTGFLTRTTDSEFYRNLLSNIPDFIFQMEINSFGNYKFPFISESAIEFFHLSKSTLRNTTQTIKRIILPEHWDTFFESVEKARENLQSWSNEFEVCVAGSKRWMRGVANLERTAEGSTVFYGRLIDITDVKAKEIQERLAEQRVQFALEASTKGVWDLDLADDKVYYSSQSMQMLNFGDAEMIDTHNKWDDRIHPDDRDDYERVIQQHLSNKTPYYENTKRMIALDGTCKWILSRGKVIERDEQGKAMRLVGTHTDITIQKQREQELTNTLEIVSAQNSRLLNFAHIVSHNLRSHAGNFSTLLHIIEEEENLSAKCESFQHLKSTSNALTETIDHLNDLVNIHTGVHHQKVNLNINEYLNRVFLILRESISSNKVTIINNIPLNAMVRFNPAYLESILLNFTTNAIKYSSVDRLPVITYNFTEDGNAKTLLIKDNGLGIDLEKYGARLFGMYKTFHNNPAARGIGLFITKNQIESMGGSVEIESKEGFGTTFKINFNEKI